MSLKSFHIFFIVVAIIFSAGFGFWCLLTEEGAALAGAKLMAVISLMAAVGLLIYLIRIPHVLQDNGIE